MALWAHYALIVNHPIALKTFLCGSKKYCAVHDSVRALVAAKKNADRYFPVIAVLEYFRETNDIRAGN